jgi:hypothetical protein
LAYLTKFPYIILINVAAKDGEDWVPERKVCG